MPTNVSPEYKKAETAYRKARDPAERLSCLKEMLQTIPKHKGTEHLQAVIKTRIKELTEELAGPRKGGARTGPVHTVRPEGAAQVVLVGPPNSGKSSLHDRLTGSHAEIGPYPHTTQAPQPGMFPYQGIQFQLVDLPPISASYMETWMPNALQLAHAALLVVDLSVPGCVENVAAIWERLDEKRISLVEDWDGRLGQGLLDPAETPEDDCCETVGAAEGRAKREGSGEDGASETDSVQDDSMQDDFAELDDPFRVYLPTLLVASKSDIGFDPGEIEILEELVGVHYPAISLSTETGEGLDRIGPLLFQGLGIVRVYTKMPGRPVDNERPFTIFRGGTVLDVARLIHKDVAESLKFARIWGSAKFDGQQVGKDHPLCDGDVVELHA